MSGSRTNRSIYPDLLSEPVKPVPQIELNRLKWFASPVSTNPQIRLLKLFTFLTCLTLALSQNKPISQSYYSNWVNGCSERTDDEYELSSMWAKRTLATARAVLVLESRTGCSRISDHQYTEPRTVSFGHVRFENRWSDDTAHACAFSSGRNVVMQVFC